MTNTERIQENNDELRECIALADNLPEGGGGVSSWNDMPAPIPESHLPEGYPHYGHGTVMRETTAMPYTHPDFGAMWLIAEVPDLKVGDTYTVKYNGGTWECQCVATPEGFVSDPDSVAMGNIAAILGTGNTGEPFAMLVDHYYGAVFIIDLTGVSYVRMGIEGNTLLPFDTKYLPGSIFTVCFDVEVGDSGQVYSVAADKTYYEVSEVAIDPNVQVRAFVRLRSRGYPVGYISLNPTMYTEGGDLTFTAQSDEYTYYEVVMRNNGDFAFRAVHYKTVST